MLLGSSILYSSFSLEQNIDPFCMQLISYFQVGNMGQLKRHLQAEYSLDRPDTRYLKEELLVFYKLMRVSGGVFIGAKNVDKIKLSPGLNRWVYILKQEKQPLYWSFDFLEERGKWRLVQLDWSSDIKKFFH
jgi:hypothetical protein